MSTSTTSQRCSNPQVAHVAPIAVRVEAVGAVAAEHVLGEHESSAAGDPVGDVDPHPAGAVLGERR